jgi:replicative DNA helicase
MLIYREDQNDKNATRKGITAILIPKQRSGPTGDIPLLRSSVNGRSLRILFRMRI